MNSRVGSHTRLVIGPFLIGHAQDAAQFSFLAKKAGTTAVSMRGVINKKQLYGVVLPQVDTDCLTLFLATVREEWPGERIGMVLDGSGSHRSAQVIWPDGMVETVASGLGIDRRVLVDRTHMTGPVSTITGAMIINMVRCGCAEALLAKGMKPVILPSHQFLDNTGAAAQLDAFYEAYRQSLKHLFE